MSDRIDLFPAKRPSEAEQKRTLGAIILSATLMSALLVLVGASDMRAHGIDATIPQATHIVD